MCCGTALAAPVGGTRTGMGGMGDAPKVTGVTGATSATASADAIRRENDDRHAVDARIERRAAEGKPATLGFLRDLVDASIAFGAPAYNRGDIEACARFYMKTAEGTVAAFASEGHASPGAARGIAGLKSALARCALVSDMDRRAWHMRFAFDKVVLNWELDHARAKGLAGLAMQSFRGERYPESIEAFTESLALVDDLTGESGTEVETVVRSGSLMLALALTAEHDHSGAARALENCLDRLPELVRHPIDLTRVFRPARLAALTSELEAAAAKPGASADVLFLCGYTTLATGHRDEALAHFKKALLADAGHRGAGRCVRALQP